MNETELENSPRNTSFIIETNNTLNQNLLTSDYSAVRACYATFTKSKRRCALLRLYLRSETFGEREDRYHDGALLLASNIHKLLS